jgi:hypothetical protein
MQPKIDSEFFQILSYEIKKDNFLTLYKILVSFKNKGMDRDSMLKNLEKLRLISDSATEDILLELMDCVTGCCNPKFSVF